MTSSNQVLGDLLRRLREEAGLSLRGLASASEVDVANVSRLERGEATKPRPDTLMRLAKALNADASELLTAAGYTSDRAEGLPSLPVYFRAKFGELPDDAMADLERYVARLQKRYGVGRPGQGEDEEPSEPPRTKSTRRPRRPTT